MSRLITDYGNEKKYFYSSSDDQLWKIVIADRNQSTQHRIKQMLSDVLYRDRGIRIFSAYSEKELANVLTMSGAAVLLYNPALHADAGEINIARYMKDKPELKNVQLVLLNGALGTGEAESGVYQDGIGEIDISKLDDKRFLSRITTALENYEDTAVTTKIDNGLTALLIALSDSGEKSSQQFSSVLLAQLLAYMNIGENAVYCRKNSDGDPGGRADFYAVSAAGKYANDLDKSVNYIFQDDLLRSIETAISDNVSIYKENHIVFNPDGDKNPDSLLIISGVRNQLAFDDSLAALFCKSIASFLDRVSLFGNLNRNLLEMIFVTDNSNTIIYYNNSFYEAFGRFFGIRNGMSMSTFLQKLKRFIVKSEDTEYFMSELKDPDVFSAEGELKIKSGTEKVFGFSLRPMTDICGIRTGRIVIFCDITDSKLQIEHLQNECMVLSKLNEKSEIIINSVSDRAKVKTEENTRIVNSLIESVFDMLIENLSVLEKTVVYNGKFKKRIKEIIEKIAYEKAHIDNFVANMEQKKEELGNAFKKFSSEMDSNKAVKMKETSLDQKEIMILQMIAALKSNKEIAKELNYEEETIKNKITVIRRKLKLSDRCHLVSFAFRNGLV